MVLLSVLRLLVLRSLPGSGGSGRRSRSPSRSFPAYVHYAIPQPRLCQQAPDVIL